MFALEAFYKAHVFVAVSKFYRCPLWVISGHFALRRSVRFTPKKRTFRTVISLSALCQKQTLRRFIRSPHRRAPLSD